MFRESNTDPEQQAEAPSGDTRRRRNRSEGYVIECDGTCAVIAATMPPDDSLTPDYWAVGSLITIRSGDVRTVGMLFKLEAPSQHWIKHEPNQVNVHVELIGEIRDNNEGKPVFLGGISAYPYLGAIAHQIRNADLHAIFANTDTSATQIGELSQNHQVPAMLSVDQLISRHFAVVGTTGVGKSTAVCLLVRKIVKTRPDLGILLLDPHNEFAAAFNDIAEVISDKTLDLPFWMFRLEEFVEVLFRGRKPDPEEVDILRDLIPVAKQRFKGDGSPNLRKTQRGPSLTADTPVPYRIADLLNLVDERAGQLDQREARLHLKALSSRIKATINDPRYHFMFANKAIVDNMATILGQIYRVPKNGKPVSILQLNGIPSEVVNAVVSVLCRLAFDLSVWSQAKVRTLVLCEEAHRYIPSNVDAGFGPTRAAIARIAKEGRKYGVSLGIITQRPSELDATILSQCSTVFAMRLGNEVDQDIMRKAISGASRSYINFLPSLANREAVGFGQGVNTPMRMTFATIDASELPGNHLAGDDEHNHATDDIDAILRAMRDPGATTDIEPEELAEDPQQAAADGPTVQQRPSVPASGGSAAPSTDNSALFTYDGPLRRATDRITSHPVTASTLQRAGRRHDDPAVEPKPQSGATRDLISRFRK